MLFSGIPFLYYFLPAVVLMYVIAPKCIKNSVLLLASLVFYAWGEPRYVVLMTVTIILGYVLGLLIERYQGKKLSKLFLILSLTIDLGFLAYFKYADFFIDNFNAVTGLGVPLLNIALPVGISFYTFQILSYTVDVYRGDAKAQRNIINLATYIALFPQLIAGPIVRYSDIAIQLENRTHSFDKVAEGIRRFVLGLGKKILIADVLAGLGTSFAASGDKSVVFFWLYGISYSLQIYFDFSGYSDMAIGLGKMFGFDFLENFNYPFISGSITEFWRRWHMSLGSWFRDYVYIPLGGNRCSKLRNIFNIFVVWMLTGFWHGAAWNFILWGVFFGIALLIEKVWLLKHLKKMKVLNHVYVLLLVLFSFVLFASVDLSQLGTNVGGLFGAGGIPFINGETVYYLRSYAVILVLAVIGATPIVKKTALKIKESKAGEKIMNVLEPIALVSLVIVMTAYLVDGSFSPFLYFRF
ncbi:MAG: MBOAT family protein [Ruminococcaceae bacterium]|nr:MBOAT family protein [Oscillospiraceae bacterium]